MFVCRKLVLVELHKTGSYHIARLLSKSVGGVRIGKHNAPTESLLRSGRAFLGSVRDPWEWYISLWAYGCDRRGAVYIMTRFSNLLRPVGLGWGANPRRAYQRLLNQKPRHPEQWRRCYEDVDDAARFREWLYMMHDETYWDEYGEGYGYSPVNTLAGLLTYRYLRLFCRNRDVLSGEELVSFADLKRFETENCFIDHFIRNESLEEDLLKALDQIGIDIPADKRFMMYSANRTNTSSRTERAAYYYDRDTSNLIKDREKLIIEKFGYAQPDV